MCDKTDKYWNNNFNHIEIWYMNRIKNVIAEKWKSKKEENKYNIIIINENGQ